MKIELRSRSRFCPIIITILLVTTLFSIFSITADPPPDEFTLRWVCTTGLDGYIGPVSRDINGDGIHEIFIAGRVHGGTSGRIVSIDGGNGNILWEKNFSGSIDPHCPCAIADLDNDGTFEIVHVADDRTIARNCEDGSIFWNVAVPSGWHQFVIVDTDGTGYPYVYVTDHGVAGGSQKVSKLRGTDGEIIAQHPIRFSCYGGISAADLEGDGEVEIIVTDTSSSGDGLQCFDADLNLIWNHDHGCESSCAVIADLDGDGVLDVITLRQYDSGICIIDGSTGAPFPGKNEGGLGLGCHCQPAVYDIDKDGHLELITAYSSTCKVWDLVDWSLDFEVPSAHKCSEPPDFANVMGDEDLELIVPSPWSGQTLIYDSNYQLIHQFNAWGYCTVTQDVDDDGLNELIYLRNDTLRCYDTLANAPTPSVRTDTPFYSERRTAAGEYIPPVVGSAGGNSAPVFSAVTPSNGASNIPIGTSSLSITIEDPDGDLFDWTIETSPDIGTNQANGASNGSKSSSISGLSYSTTHHWFVNATDGSSWTNESYSFTTEGAPNNPPNTPSSPSPANHATGVDNDANLIWTGGDPDAGDTVTYDVYFGTSSTPPKVVSNASSTSYDPGTMSYDTKYYWKIVAWDNHDASAVGSIWDFTTEGAPNNPPNTPSEPTGPQYIGADLIAEYTTSATDPDGNHVYCWFDWGDNNVSGWIGPFESGGTCTASHSWSKPGNYSIKVKARDIYDAESGWSPSITVTIVEVGPKADAGGPYVGFEGKSIQFSGLVTGGEEPYSWSWDFGDEIGTSTQQNPTYIYDSPGDYIVSLTVTDSNGDPDTDYAEVYVAPEDTLIVDSGGPYSGFSDETIEFTSSVVGGTPPYYWHWKFGDGDTSDEQNPLHVYVSKGNYTVTLTVTDNEGLTGNDTTIATISEEDTAKPTVEIINPEDNFIYLLNSKLVPSFRTWIIGRITIDVEASDTESGIDYVEFYVDGKLKSTDITPPYSWEWSETTFFQHVIKVIAYDNVGNWESKELIIWKLF